MASTQVKQYDGGENVDVSRMNQKFAIMACGVHQTHKFTMEWCFEIHKDGPSQTIFMQLLYRRCVNPQYQELHMYRHGSPRASLSMLFLFRMSAQSTGRKTKTCLWHATRVGDARARLRLSRTNIKQSKRYRLHTTHISFRLVRVSCPSDYAILDVGLE